MSLFVGCDAPDCEASTTTDSDTYRSWLWASLQVARQESCCDDHGWGWQSDGSVRVDACSVEHLRVGMAVKIAELTDEHHHAG